MPRPRRERALRDVLGYRLYRDLQRGWRITSPNLEQCGLMASSTRRSTNLCAAEEVWQGRHQALATATQDVRKDVARVLLDLMRRDLAIKVDYLDATRRSRSIGERAAAQGALGLRRGRTGELLEHATMLLPRSDQANAITRDYVSCRRSGAFGQFLRRPTTFPDLGVSSTSPR